jgi:hypothetical protein
VARQLSIPYHLDDCSRAAAAALLLLFCNIQLVLQEPSLLCWSPQQLKKRLQNMASCLGLQQQQLLQLLQHHPQLLPASYHLAASLRLLQQLLQLAAAAETAAQQTYGSSNHTAAAAEVGQAQQQQERQQPLVPAAAVRSFALSHPQLLLQQPDDIVARLATLQAQSGLSLGEVAAVMAANPHLLLADLGAADMGSASTRGRGSRGRSRSSS